jgi:DNA-binding response OmpR family regulator
MKELRTHHAGAQWPTIGRIACVGRLSPQHEAMKRVLIVEDQPEIRELIHMTLEFENYELHEAPNGDAALQMIEKVKPDLLLLDVMMPGSLNGLELCKRVKADPNHKKAKVVMLSARSQASDRQAGLTAGADAYLSKPFSPRELLQLITRMV